MQCKCDDGYSGRYCQLKIRCFDDSSSSMQFPLHQPIFALTQEFRTLNPVNFPGKDWKSLIAIPPYERGCTRQLFQSSLLLSSFAAAESKEPHFTLALENGQVHLSWNSSQKRDELVLEEKVNDGKWKMIRFRYKHQRVKLTVQHCDEDGYCKPCKSFRCVATTTAAAANNTFQCVFTFTYLKKKTLKCFDSFCI